MKVGFPASVAVAVTILLGGAEPASAHAVLLRTDPGPQSTVPRSPSQIRLEYSERVEVAFGAIRVFDVDGRLVDAGRVRRIAGGRQVVMPVAGLRNGTYTVTWRVASDDGHSLSGGFVFYVGAPSSISAVAIEGDRGAGTWFGWQYGAVRFAWYVGFVAVVGMVAARRWVWTPAVRAAGLGRSPAAGEFRRLFAKALPLSWALLATAGALVIVFQGAALSGRSLLSAARPSVTGEVLRTGSGHAWLIQMAFTAALLVPVLALVRRRPLLGVGPRVWLAVCALSAFGLALAHGWSGHARAQARPALGVLSVGIHLTAVGAWVGGLATLVVLGGLARRGLPVEDRRDLLVRLVPLFSRLGLIAVALIVLTGVVNSTGELASVSDLWKVSYGRLLTAKILLMAFALGLAARHLRVTPKRLSGDTQGTTSMRSFTRSSIMELVLVVAALTVAAGLVAGVPGRSLALAAKGAVNQEHRIGTYTAQLFVDPTAVGANQLHVTFVNNQGLAAAEVANAEVSLGPAGPGSVRGAPVQMRLIAPGHFVGDVQLPVPRRYRVSVTTPAAPGARIDFEFRLFGPGS